MADSIIHIAYSTINGSFILVQIDPWRVSALALGLVDSHRNLKSGSTRKAHDRTMMEQVRQTLTAIVSNSHTILHQLSHWSRRWCLL